MKRVIEITHMTDAALDVVLAARSGAEHITCEHLTAMERHHVAEALGWPMDARTRFWIAPWPASERSPCGPDYEAMILEDQEDFSS